MCRIPPHIFRVLSICLIWTSSTDRKWHLWAHWARCTGGLKSEMNFFFSHFIWLSSYGMRDGRVTVDSLSTDCKSPPKLHINCNGTSGPRTRRTLMISVLNPSISILNVLNKGKRFFRVYVSSWSISEDKVQNSMFIKVDMINHFTPLCQHWTLYMVHLSALVHTV